MQGITKQKYFYYLAFMLIITTFLPLVTNNLPSVFRSHHLYTTVWVISILFLHPTILINKTILYTITYGLLFFLATKSIWYNLDDWNFREFYTEFYNIIIGISIITYFLTNKDYVGLAKLTKWAIVFLIITAIMSIFSSYIDPMYARNFGGYSELSEGKQAEILGFKRYGGGTYSTAGAFMSLFPIFIYYYKNIERSLISKRYIIIISFIIFIGLLRMQIFTNILIAILFGFIAFLGMKKINRTLIIIGFIVFILFFIPKSYYVNSLFSISTNFDKNSETYNKLTDLAFFINKGVDFDDTSTGAGGRAQRYPILIESFVKSPLLGCFFLSDKNGNGYDGAGGHLHWMNKLTTTGVIGFYFFLLIIYMFIKSQNRYFYHEYKFYYLIASFSILAYGLFKTIAGRETWYAFFIILPGLYYLPLLKKDKKNKQLR